MKKKAISLLLVAAMTATMTAGCGDKQEAADNTTAGNDAAPSTEAAASDDAATEEEEAWSGTLTVWSPQEDQDTGWLQKECDAFNAAHPNWDVTFEYGVCAEGDAKATVTTDVEGSADVYMLANDNIPDLVAANALAELGGSYLDYVTSTNSDSITASVTYNDAVVAFPFTSNTWFMYYDKSVFSDEDIKSFDTMLEKGKVAFPLSDSWYIQAFYVGNGCSLFGDGTDAAAGIDFDGEKAAAVTDYLVDVVANPNFINDADGAGLAGLRDGSVNAVFSGTWNAEAVKEAFLEAYPEKSACDAYYVSNRTGDFGTLAKRLASGDTKNYNYLVSYESPIDGGVNLWHCGEIPFVFHNVDLVAGSYGGSQDAYDLQDVMASAWVNFARTGDPNGDNVPEWSTYTSDNKSTMVFDTTSGERVDYDAELQELISQ